MAQTPRLIKKGSGKEDKGAKTFKSFFKRGKK